MTGRGRKTFRIWGRVVDSRTGQGIGGLRIEAWDQDLVFNDFVGSAVTDSQGAFIIEFDQSYFKEVFFDRRPDLFLKVFWNSRLIKSTKDLVLWNLEAGEKEITVTVDMQGLGQPNQHQGFVVSGQVRMADDTPLAETLTVSAFDKDLRTEQLLGEAQTDRDGRYEIKYTANQFSRAEKKSADLIVRVYSRNRQLLYESGPDEVLFNAPRVAVIDIQLQTGDTGLDSEYERIMRSILPIVGDLAIQDLQEDGQTRDITFLNRETGWAADRLEHLVVAHRLSTSSGIETEFYYALLRENTLLKMDLAATIQSQFEVTLSSDLKLLFYQIVLLDPEVIRKGINQAIRVGHVSGELAAKLDAVLKKLGAHTMEAGEYLRNEHPRRIFRLIERNLTSGKIAEALQFLQQGSQDDILKLLNGLSQAGVFLSEDDETDAGTNLHLGEILGFDEDIIEHVRERQGIRKPEEVYKLAALNPAGWKEVLTGFTGTIKLGGAALRAELIDLHAASLARKLEKRFPTTAFHAQLERDADSKLPHKETILKLLNEHPAFDLATTRIEEFCKRKEVAVLTGPDPEGVKDSLKTVQRVFKLVPHYRKANTLLAEGIHSAQSIQAMGEAQFVSRFGDRGSLTKKEAREIYRKSADTHTATLMLATDIHSTVTAAQVHALSGLLTAEKLEVVTRDFPNLKSLFQLTDLCQCEHCRSVYSPAAYLVDVLQFLKCRLVLDMTDTTPPSLKSAKKVLFDRRPDIGDLDLSCENTNTPLPYIDLVCELLEDVVAPDPGIVFNGAIAPGTVPDALRTLLQAKGFPITDQAVVFKQDAQGYFILRDRKVVFKVDEDGPGKWILKRMRQTQLSAEELKAAPEYLNKVAYDTLQAGKYAFRLPFDLYHQEAKGYLEQFDIRRADLMQTLQKGGSPEDFAVAADALGIADEERKLIVTPDPDNQYVFWNTGAATVVNEMKVLDTLLTKSELTYEQLVELLKQSWVNPSDVMFIQHLDSTCDTQQKHIANLSTLALDRIHRFLRLWRATGWSMAALNQAITYRRLGDQQLDNACLTKIDGLRRLKEKLGLPVEELCIFYGPIPMDGENSRYQQVFLNKAANGFIEEAFQPENILANEMAPPASRKKLADCKETLSLYLGIKPADLDLLLNSLGGAAILSFANLAALYTVNLLARRLGLKIEDYLILRHLTGIPVFDSPADTLRFIEKTAKVKAAGVVAADLQYLLQHDASDINARMMKEENITSLLGRLQEEYQQAFNEARSPYDDTLTAEENKGAVKELLGRLPNFDEAALATFMSIIDNNWQDSAQTPAAFIDEKLGEYFNTGTIKARQASLATPGGNIETKRKALIAAVLYTLEGYFFRQAKESILTRVMMEAFKTGEEITRILVCSARLKWPLSAGNRTLLDLLNSEQLIDKVHTPPVLPAITPGGFGLQYAAVRLYHKMTPFVVGLPLRNDEIEWMFLHNADLGWMELDNLAYDTTIPAVDFEKWEMLQDAIGLIKAFPPVADPADLSRPVSLLLLLELVLDPLAALDDVLNLLARLRGWDEVALRDLDTHFGFSTPDLSAYRSPATYLALEKTVELLRRLSLDVATALEMIKPVLTLADVKALRSALKTRYEEAQWLDVLKGIQDKLRNQKRDALVAYILAVNPDFTSSNDLYDYFLIDVEMDARQPTSRIVQAHGTIQLFVQRCLMGLEPRAVADVTHDSDWEQWKWMKNYRVWEANRKVFLYPENWIEPELRDDKSFLFKGLENELLQNELNERTVEDAAIHYLETLDEIARLEVCAVYYQTSICTMHVFTRTKGGDPATYYYRRFEKERYWTPWEKVELDIVGDHLMAFERNGRLYLAWPLFSEEPYQDQSIAVPSSAPGTPIEKTQKSWKVQLAISEHAGSKWLPKRVSKKALYTPDLYEILPIQEDFHFTVVDLKQFGFYICCYYVENGKKPGGSWNWWNGTSTSYLGTFSLTGCKGYPEIVSLPGGLPGFQFLPQFKDTAFKNLRFREMNQDAMDDLAVRTVFSLGDFVALVKKTPGRFQITYPRQVTIIDGILVLLQMILTNRSDGNRAIMKRSPVIPLGTLMPFFYEDRDRGYVIVPGFYDPVKRLENNGPMQRTFSDILKFVQDAIKLLMEYWQKWRQKVASLPELLEELVQDEEFIRLGAEFNTYQTLRPGYKFRNFYHPLVCSLRTAVYKDGIPGLMKHEVQMQKTGFDFGSNNAYEPTPRVIAPYPIEDIDFEPDGSYASYNWELFFHLPFLVAVKLSQEQRFEEAMDWFHYIFNPTGALGGSAPSKYWVTKPFHLYQTGDYVEQRIDTILYEIAADPSGATLGTTLKTAVEDWRGKPFKPHVIARSRPVAYQKAILMKYIDNLIAWGDYLFRQDTMESVNQATQLYILAEKLLGPKPRIVPPVVEPQASTYNQLELEIDLFGNVLLNELENLIPDLSLLPHGGDELPPPPLTFSSLYFCIPQNDRLLEYWDRVADRLFKIRHCLNINGVERVLALFAPPIDPGALVRAAAAGLDIADVLKGLSAPTPLYRFNVMAQKATELVQEVRTLGSALLQALEKKDAEELALLRSTHELRVLNAVKTVKEQQIVEAKETLEGLEKAKAVIEERRKYYRDIDKHNATEVIAMTLHGGAIVSEIVATVLNAAAGAAHLVPNIKVGASGFGGSPHMTVEFGGDNVGKSSFNWGSFFSGLGGVLHSGANLTSTMAGYERRWDEWKLQERLADKEIEQVQKQIAAAQIRSEIVEQDLKNQILQIENARAVDDYMRSKFTNQELYQWMIGQISSVYFRAYQLAFETAKKAERCFCHELGSSGSFIQAGYWDSLKKGLQSADHLLHDIKRMEVAYLDQNKREYELTKHVSLAMLDPMALLQLKNTGTCTINMPEAIFDMDHPGHYMRRLKSVSLSIPCVVGPYGSASAKLSLVSNKYRKSTVTNAGVGTPKEKYQEIAGNDERFVSNVGTIQSIATSNAQNDSGMFELNFRDERYLPFEGTGAVSTWQLEMPKVFKQFDYSTISDVIIHLGYTARDGGSSFKTLVEDALRELLNEMLLQAGRTGLFKALDLKREFPQEWHKLKQDHSVELAIKEQHLPLFVQGHDPGIENITWLARVIGNPDIFMMSLNGASFDLTRDENLNNLYVGVSDPITLGTAFALSATSTTDLEELVVLVKYTLSS